MRKPFSYIKTTMASVTISVAATLSSATHADIVGLYAGAGVWQGSFDGDIGADANPITIDELNIDDTQNTFFYAALEHPVPVIPNIRIAVNDISSDGRATVSREFVFNDLSTPISGDVLTEVDLSFIDYTLYYEILDNYISADIGLSGRVFDGFAQITQTDINTEDGAPATQRVSLDEVLPMLYLKAQLDLPFTGWYAGAVVNYIGYEDSSISDFEAKIGYLTSGLGLDIGFDIGFREFALVVDPDNDSLNDNLKADVSLGGPYASFNLHF